MRKGLLTVMGLSLLLILVTSGVKKVDSANGRTGSTSGCTGCHNGPTGTVTLTGLAANVKANTSYPFGLTYSAGGSSYKYWGLDLKVSVGTLTAGTGERMSGTTELTHSNPMAYTGTAYVYPTMTWKTPTTLGAAKFSYACVAGSSTGTQGGPSQAGTFSCTVVSGAPVEFASFNAGWVGDNKVTIVWKTATESNTDFFEVERSLNGETYSPINNVRAAGTSDQTKTYTYNDVVTSAKVAYYRIKAVDKDGTPTYSSVKMVNIKPVKNYVNGIYPNPVVAGQSMNVQYVAIENGKVNVELYNCLGKKMSSLTVDAVTGENAIKFNAGRFVSPGIYYVVVSNGTEKIAQLPVSVQ